MSLNFFIKRSHYLVIAFTAVYLMAFTANAFLNRNFEFLYYTVVMIALIYIVFLFDKHLQLGPFIIMNLSILGFLHLLGGNVHIGDTRLYDTYFFRGLLKYDNLIHMYGTFIATLALYNIIVPFVGDTVLRKKRQFLALALLLILMALGVGAANEMVEFLAVVFLGAAEQVGGYYNNSLDLFFNSLGALFACIVIFTYRERQHVLPKINRQIKKVR